jgi:hypothetical protein
MIISLVLQNVVPQTDGVTLRFRTSNSGSPYDSGASDYVDQSGSVSYIQIGPSNVSGSGTGEGFSGDLTIFNPGDTTHTYVRMSGANYSSTVDQVFGS